MLDHAVGFVHRLRAAGLDVPVGASVTYAEALAAVGVATRERVYWAGRATLVRRPEHFELYDRTFAAYWGGALPAAVAVEDPSVVALLDDDDLAADGADGAPAGDVLTVRYSPAEVLRHKDLATCTPAELTEAHRLMAQLRVAGARRRSRRLRPTAATRGAHHRPDLRRTVRDSLRTGGELARLRRRAPGTRPRPVVLLLDVSGSMEPYARALLRFAHAAVAGRRHIEVFTLGTRLTRVTRELATHDPDVALRNATGSVHDWSGGTRLGEALRAFNDQWGVRGLARGAIVVVLSDGWDRGQPTALAEEMQRLGRVAHRIVWVNPLKASPGYAPLARGMAAALPHVDVFVEGHSVAALSDLVEVIAS